MCGDPGHGSAREPSLMDVGSVGSAVSVCYMQNQLDYYMCLEDWVIG